MRDREDILSIASYWTDYSEKGKRPYTLLCLVLEVLLDIRELLLEDSCENTPPTNGAY